MVKKRETQCAGEIIKKMVKKYKRSERQKMMFLTANNYANPVRMYYHMKICFLLWKRYLQIYQNCDKDSVDIDSDDFKLSEQEEEKVIQKVKNLAETEINDAKKVARRTDRITRLTQIKSKAKKTDELSETQSVATIVQPKDLKDIFELPANKTPYSSTQQNRRNTTKPVMSSRWSQVVPLGLGSRKFSARLPTIKDEGHLEHDISIDDSRQGIAEDSRLD